MPGGQVDDCNQNQAGKPVIIDQVEGKVDSLELGQPVDVRKRICSERFGLLPDEHKLIDSQGEAPRFNT